MLREREREAQRSVTVKIKTKRKGQKGGLMLSTQPQSASRQTDRRRERKTASTLLCDRDSAESPCFVLFIACTIQQKSQSSGDESAFGTDQSTTETTESKRGSFGRDTDSPLRFIR